MKPHVKPFVCVHDYINKHDNIKDASGRNIELSEVADLLNSFVGKHVLVELDTECICHGNWRLIVKETNHLLNERFTDSNGTEYTFFGIVHGHDDYYYGMSDSKHKVRLLSCVGSITMHGFTLIE